MRYSLLLLVFWAGLLSAQIQEKRVALVIGNSNYANNLLINPANDARDMAAVLRRAGFSVVEKYDQNFTNFNNAVTDFTRSFKDSNTVALFYYAGHGVQDNSENYLVPIDADSLVEDEITYRCVPLERITAKMKGANNYMNIIILDACRNFQIQMKGRTIQWGLAQFEDNLSESLIAYATAPGRTALDQSDRANGLFTENLLKHILTPGLEISEIFFEVRKDVKRQSNNKQVPSLVNNLTRKFYFFGVPTLEQPQAAPIDTDKDGVPDASDRCPYDFGQVGLQGCPDSDHDGVINMLDKCPQVFGSLSNQGCPDENRGPKKSSGWESCIGVSYSRFGMNDETGAYLKSVSYSGYQVYYTLVNKIGGFVSLGGYSGGYDLSTSSDYTIPMHVVGALGPGIRILNTSSDVNVCAFAGLMLFGSGTDKGEETFGHRTNYIGYEFLLTGSIHKVGLKAGFITGFEKIKGFTVGMHYCF
ncbi:MAG: caspase domain-containing protein [Saprospiraceae bacterium]